MTFRLTRRMMRRTTRYGPWAAMRKAATALGMALLVLASGSADAETRIVALGDSLIHGYGLRQEEGFTRQLEAWLRENGAPEAVVVNAGVSGDTTAGGLARFDWSVGEAADALIVEFGGNDLLRGIDPASSRANLDGIMEKAEARDLPVLLTGMEAPANYGPDYKASFDAIYPDLAEKYGALYDPFFLEGLVDEPRLFQEDGIHPNKAGVARLVERFGPLVLDLIERADAGS